MQIYLQNQQKNFPTLLKAFKKASVMHYDRSMLVEKVSEITLTAKQSLEELNLQALFSYRIFPENILVALGQWETEHRPMQVGDTIIQQVFLPPIQSFSQKVILGVRICEIINQPQKKGFSYETLEGHVEKGISGFFVEQTIAGLIFRIHTLSLPGNRLSKFLAPVFSIPYQTYCTNAALVNFKQIILTTNLIE